MQRSRVVDVWRYLQTAAASAPAAVLMFVQAALQSPCVQVAETHALVLHVAGIMSAYALLPLLLCVFYVGDNGDAGGAGANTTAAGLQMLSPVWSFLVRSLQLSMLVSGFSSLLNSHLPQPLDSFLVRYVPSLAPSKSPLPSLRGWTQLVYAFNLCVVAVACIVMLLAEPVCLVLDIVYGSRLASKRISESEERASAGDAEAEAVLWKLGILVPSTMAACATAGMIYMLWTAFHAPRTASVLASLVCLAVLGTLWSEAGIISECAGLCLYISFVVLRAFMDTQPSSFDLCDGAGPPALEEQQQLLALMGTHLNWSVIVWLVSSALTIYTCLRGPVLLMRAADVTESRVRSVTQASVSFKCIRAVTIIWSLAFRFLLFQRLARVYAWLCIVPCLTCAGLYMGLQLFTEGIDEDGD
ncbi:hypothetical protein FVE85_0969 [Porphyridium purpureum]|uniref:Transmembrane protein n=1 Tax=Porphyridium purpureum TaxID=35688 RepID=A0A5J4Z1T4_PORPP|nr:hypothetical protein FVE85_0969 [Porphyridium purpureum]|eukprot:POR3979..scf208_2